ncbi:MAG: rRNA maturation RNase YbeY [Actinomycetota bacterium]|nr:rRNA maturation RNase YbeY [Actinomycetota bacterium]
MKVEIINNQKKVELDLDLIKRVSEYISNKFDKDKKKQLNIIFLDSNDIRELNKKYRNVDRETDVLSFSYASDDEPVIPEEISCPVTVGEIFICPEVAYSNVAVQSSDWNLLLEIIMLIIHGILHIYNYDHENEEDRITMEAIQNSILSDVRSAFGL